MSKELKATVKSSGKQIQVYKLKSGKWCDAHDCTTQYESNELTFKK